MKYFLFLFFIFNVVLASCQNNFEIVNDAVLNQRRNFFDKKVDSINIDSIIAFTNDNFKEEVRKIDSLTNLIVYQVNNLMIDLVSFVESVEDDKAVLMLSNYDELPNRDLYEKSNIFLLGESKRFKALKDLINNFYDGIDEIILSSTLDNKLKIRIQKELKKYKIDTQDRIIKGLEGPKSWESYIVENSPIIATIIHSYKIKTDLRNYEFKIIELINE